MRRRVIGMSSDALLTGWRMAALLCASRSAGRSTATPCLARPF